MRGDGGGTGVAKKKARGVGKHVRIDPDIVVKAKRVAEDKGMALGDYLSDICRPRVERDWDRVMKRIIESEGGEE